MNLTGKTIGQLTQLSGITPDTLFAVENSGFTYQIPYSAFSGIIDITYSDLYNKIINKELIPTQEYRITDYRSVNFLNGQDTAENNPTPIVPSFNPREIYEGDIEPLVVQAVSDYELNPVCRSEKFDQDILEYNGFYNKIGLFLGISTGVNLPDSTIVNDFNLKWDGVNNEVYVDMPTNYPVLFGQRLYLYATFSSGADELISTFQLTTPFICNGNSYFNTLKNIKEIKISADGKRFVIVGLDYNDFLNYDIDTLFVETRYAFGNAYGLVTKRNDTYQNVTAPFDYRNKKYRRYEIDLTPFVTNLGVGYWGIGDNPYIDSLATNVPTTGNYQDFYSFNNYDVCFNIYWENFVNYQLSDNNVIFGAFYDNQIYAITTNNTFVEFGQNNLIGNFRNNIGYGMGSCVLSNFIGNLMYNFSVNRFSDCVTNTFKGSCYGNTNTSSFYNNTIGGVFYENTIGSNFNANEIGDSFSNNTIGNDFVRNVIGIGFSYNKIGNVFVQNLSIGDGFQSNTIGNAFLRNISIGGNFKYNQIADDFYRNEVGDNFKNNIIDVAISNSTIANNFVYNTIKYGFNAIDFSLSTLVYQDYNKIIQKASDGNLYIQYFDGTNNQNITPITT